MSLTLRNPPPAYSARSERERNRSLELADVQNRKQGRDIEVGEDRLILKSPDGTRWNITVSDMGVILATSLP